MKIKKKQPRVLRFLSVSSLTSAYCLLPILIFGGCTSTSRPDRVVPFTGDYLAYYEANIDAASPRNKTLWQYRAAGTAIRRNECDLAKTYLDSAFTSTTAAYDQPDKDAAKSRGPFKGEADKPFVGEPYERVMANFYRAILYWADGELDNARTLLRAAAFNDSDFVGKTYAADYILLDYLDGLITAKLTGNNPAAGAEALARARANADVQHAPAPPDYDLAANVHLFVEFGRVPQKNAVGKAGERLQFQIRDTSIKHVQLSIDGRTYTVPAYDDLGYQAVTRGLRVIDYILNNKIVFKTSSSNPSAPSCATLPRPATPSNSSAKPHFDPFYALPAIIIAGASVAALETGAKALSNATKLEADTRTWDNLPRYLCYLSLRLPPGEHTATLDFLDEEMKPIYLQKQTFQITVPPSSTTSTSAPKDIIVFRSQLHN